MKRKEVGNVAAIRARVVRRCIKLEMNEVQAAGDTQPEAAIPALGDPRGEPRRQPSLPLPGDRRVEPIGGEA